MGPNSHYLHIMHSHGNRELGYDDISTSHIESLWASLKHLIKKIYNMISNVNFYGLLKECEFRFIISHYSNTNKLNAFF